MMLSTHKILYGLLLLTSPPFFFFFSLPPPPQHLQICMGLYYNMCFTVATKGLTLSQFYIDLLYVCMMSTQQIH